MQTVPRGLRMTAALLRFANKSGGEKVNERCLTLNLTM